MNEIQGKTVDFVEQSQTRITIRFVDGSKFVIDAFTLVELDAEYYGPSSCNECRMDDGHKMDCSERHKL